MALPTFANVLPGVEVVESVSEITAPVSASAPGVFIPWSFFQAAGVSDTATLDNPEGIISAIVGYPYEWYRADTTEQPNVEYDPMRPTIITRDGENKIAYQYGLTFYQDFSVPNMDPDAVATS